MDVLMLKPVFKDAIWGGKLLSDFGYKEAGDSAGAGKIIENYLEIWKGMFSLY